MAVFKTAQLFLTSLYLTTTCSGQCHDIDTTACQTMASNNANLCKDPALSLTACPKFCKKCPLVCYQCDSPVRNYIDCNTTRPCQSGEQCMLHQLISSKDEHHEYKMNCASLDMCDGQGVLVFGHRYTRNVMTQCCSDDLCNTPGYQKTTECDRDIEVLFQDSRASDGHSVKKFLKDLVSHIKIGQDHNLLSVAAYSHDVDTKIHFDSNMDAADLLRAIDSIDFDRDDNSIDKGDVLEYLAKHVHTNRHGNRLLQKDVVIIITDHYFDQNRRRFLYSDTGLGGYAAHFTHQPAIDISSLSKDVIVINIGTAAVNSAFSSWATSANHVIDVKDYSMLSSTLPRLLSLLCV